MPNNKCGENIDHHDHENEIQHLHQHNVGHILSLENILSSNTTYDTIISRVIITNTNTNNYTNQEPLSRNINSATSSFDSLGIKSPINQTNKTNNLLEDESGPSVPLITNKPCICIDKSDRRSISKSDKHSVHNTSDSNLHVIVSHGHSHSHKYKVSETE